MDNNTIILLSGAMCKLSISLKCSFGENTLLMYSC